MANNVKKNSVDDSPEKGIIIQNITVRPVVRQSQDIAKWRAAISAAEGIIQYRTSLYDLYEDIMLDAVLTSLVEKRILGVTKTKLLFVDKAGKEIPAVTELIQKRQFREMRKEIQLHKVWGISVIELINDAQGFRIFSAPRKHIKPKEGIVTYEQNGTDGVAYRQPPANKFILECGHWNEFGLLMKAAQYVIYKRGGFGDWAHFAEIFGMPFREARYDGFNDAVRKQLEMALEQAGSAGYAILPKEAELTFHEASNTQGSGELYNSLRKACNEELSILFLGQTETTAKTAGKLGGNDDTHEQTENDINYNDKLDELSILNEQVKPILQSLGFPVDGGSFIHEEREESVPITDRVNAIVRLKKEAGLPMDDDYLYETFNIPKPADYEQQKKKIEDQANAAMQQKPVPGKPPGKKPAPKDKEKLSWFEEFRLHMADFFDPAPKS